MRPVSPAAGKVLPQALPQHPLTGQRVRVTGGFWTGRVLHVRSVWTGWDGELVASLVHHPADRFQFAAEPVRWLESA